MKKGILNNTPNLADVFAIGIFPTRVGVFLLSGGRRHLS
jgi:hypothetical protein